MFTRIKQTWRKIRTKILCRIYKNLSCESGTIIDKQVEIDNSGYIRIGKNTTISRWVVLRNWGGYIKIGDNCSVNSFSHLSGNGGIEIGNNVRIASHTTIISANHNFDRTDIPIVMQGETKKKIIIEDDCWIGSGVRVLAGVKIETGSVIGAGSVVTHNIPAYSVVVGVPGKVIKTREKES